MSNLRIAQGVEFTNPAVKEFIETAKSQIIASIAQALGALNAPSTFAYRAAPLSGLGKTYTGVGDVVAGLMKSRPMETRTAMMRAFTSANTLRSVNLKSAQPVSKQVNHKVLYHNMNGTTMSERVVSGQVAQFNVSEFSATAVSRNTGLRFKLHEVKCLDETNGYWTELIGGDEINMGASIIDDHGKLITVNEFKVADNFDDGDSKKYSPAKVLYNFPIDQNFSKPKTFAVTVILCEKDAGGGFMDFLTRLYNAIKDELDAILGRLEANAGPYIAAEVAAALGLGSLVGPLGILVAVAATKIFDIIRGMLRTGFADDIFKTLPGHQAILVLGSATATFNGSLTSPIQTMTFADHQGKYLVYYSWELAH